jgi:hypothetical protein
MTIRNVTKNRAGMEDLLTGRGNEQQDRAGLTVTVSKVDVAFAVDTVADMQALDVARFTRARVYASANNYMTYAYDATDNSGISSDTGSGTWKEVPESESVVVATDKAALRNEEPAYNFQAAFALGGSALYTGAGAAYFYDPNSAAADDGDDILVTTAGARWVKWLGAASSGVGASYVVASGGTNNLEVTLGVAAMPENQVVFIKADSTNTGAATLKVDALSAVNIVKVDGSALAAGDLEADKVYSFVLKSSGAILMNPSVNQARAEAGTDNISIPTMLRVKQHVDKRIADGDVLSQSSLYSLLAGLNIEEGFEYLYANSTGDSIAPGCCSSRDGTALLVSTSVQLKNIADPWVEGAGGGRPAGVSLVAGDWYFLHIIGKPDGTVDAGFDTEVDASNLLLTATGYTKYRPIGMRLYYPDTTVVKPLNAGFTQGHWGINIRDIGKRNSAFLVQSSITWNWPDSGYAGNINYTVEVELVGGGGGGKSASSGNGSSGGTTTLELDGVTYQTSGGQGGSYSDRTPASVPSFADMDNVIFAKRGNAVSHGVNAEAGQRGCLHPKFELTNGTNFGEGGDSELDIGGPIYAGCSGAWLKVRGRVRLSGASSYKESAIVVGAGGSRSGAAAGVTNGRPGCVYIYI